MMIDHYFSGKRIAFLSLAIIIIFAGALGLVLFKSVSSVIHHEGKNNLTFFLFLAQYGIN